MVLGKQEKGERLSWPGPALPGPARLLPAAA